MVVILVEVCLDGSNLKVVITNIIQKIASFIELMTLSPIISTIGRSDALYPQLLRQIPDAPEELFVWGDPQILNNNALAIIGTRKPSDYGIQATAYFAQNCAYSLSIVSGLAYGIDTVALLEALAAAGQPVIAVIGSGLDRSNFYPSANYHLAEKIVASGGAIVTEYPLGTPPLKHHFPARNRIIAGLSKGVLVIEAGERSGALITANLALDYNREVMALAGNIFIDQAKGSNRLIKEGAALITNLGDIAEVLNLQLELPIDKCAVTDHPDGAIESKINQIISELSLTSDEIARQLKLDSAIVSSTLTLMEIKGIVRLNSSGKFTKLH